MTDVNKRIPESLITRWTDEDGNRVVRVMYRLPKQCCPCGNEMGESRHVLKSGTLKGEMFDISPECCSVECVQRFSNKGENK